jgi:hypothetical protein
MAKTTEVFSNIQKKFSSTGLALRTAESRDWFAANLKRYGSLSRRNILKDPSLIRKTSIDSKPTSIGRMYMFMYDPKNKETLPYFDKFPLILMVGPAKDGFYGLNLHYLPPRLRALLFDRLLPYTNNDKFDQTTRFRLTYQLLTSVSKLKIFQPCFKHYLMKHVTSFTMEVPANEWEIAMFLPIDQFAYKSKSAIWNDSKKIIS